MPHPSMFAGCSLHFLRLFCGQIQFPISLLLSQWPRTSFLNTFCTSIEFLGYMISNFPKKLRPFYKHVLVILYQFHLMSLVFVLALPRVIYEYIRFVFSLLHIQLLHTNHLYKFYTLIESLGYMISNFQKKLRPFYKHVLVILYQFHLMSLVFGVALPHGIYEYIQFVFSLLHIQLLHTNHSYTFYTLIESLGYMISNFQK